MSDVISIKGLKLFGTHGVFPEEREKGQTFLIDVDCHLNVEKAAQTDAYAEAVCYNQVCHAVAHASKQGPYNLIETLADRIANSVLERFPQIHAIDVIVYKPDAPVDFDISHTQVKLSRRRSYRVAFGLGSNIGNKTANIHRALNYLQTTQDVQLSAISSFYESAPQGPVDQGDFINACAIGTAQIQPLEVLRIIKRLELDMGRTHTTHWGPREIDIDLLVHGESEGDFGDLSEQGVPTLTLPHPRMFERGFVLLPLSEIAPNWSVKGQQIKDYATKHDWASEALKIIPKG